MAIDLDHLRQWIGRREERVDHLGTTPVAALQATLDLDAPAPKAGDRLPPLYHWLYFLPLHRQSELGPDGHARRGGFLPPVSLPRRMWAGGRLEFRRALPLGSDATKVSTITDVQYKSGRSGELVFVVVRHEIGDAGGVAIVEEHDIVYRDSAVRDAAPPAGMPAPTPERWQRAIVPDDVLLFRYSALTFNSHRIHYDRRYATGIEGYPGLVVHGPLQATLLLDLVQRELPDATVSRFEFRALRPVFDTAAFRVCGCPDGEGSLRLWTADAQGFVAIDAKASLA